jgi:hypothetical protein
MILLERITRAGYNVNVLWECDFELLEVFQVKEQHRPLRNRYVLYGVRNDPKRKNYRIQYGKETIQKVDVMTSKRDITKVFKSLDTTLDVTNVKQSPTIRWPKTKSWRRLMHNAT